MKILLNGASGLIGSRLTLRLIENGHTPILLGRDAAKLRERFPLPCEFYSWDSEKGEVPIQALEGVQAVIHLAGEPIAGKKWTKDQKRRIRNSRVHSTRALVDALLHQPNAHPKIFICSSAIGIYGDRGDERLNEASSLAEGFLPEVCTAWEREAKRASEISPELRCVQLRTGIVLAREGGALSKIVPPFLAGLGGPIGNGNQWMSWIHIEDMVEIICHALVNPKLSGPINVVAPQAVTNQVFSQTLSAVLHKPCRVRVPKFVLRLALGEMSQLVLSSQRVEPMRLLEAEYPFRHPSLREALIDLFDQDHGPSLCSVLRPRLSRKPSKTPRETPSELKSPN